MIRLLNKKANAVRLWRTRYVIRNDSFSRETKLSAIQGAAELCKALGFASRLNDRLSRKKNTCFTRRGQLPASKCVHGGFPHTRGVCWAALRKGRGQAFGTQFAINATLTRDLSISQLNYPGNPPGCLVFAQIVHSVRARRVVATLSVNNWRSILLNLIWLTL